MKTLFILILTLAVAYFWHRNSQKKLIEKNGFKKANSALELEQASKSEFRCVVIKPGRNACSSSQALKNKPILMNEAISLPLRACDKAMCDCKFTRHDDRRVGERRNDIYVSRQIMVDENNSREKKDRRDRG